jgi:hypothetical protein
VIKARWPADRLPPPGTHACWLAAVFTRFDAPLPGHHVWEHNNLAQKNLAVVDLVPNDWFLLPFVVNRFALESRPVVLEVWRPEGFERMTVAVHQPSGTALEGLPAGRVALPQADGMQERAEQLDCGGGPPHDNALAFPRAEMASLSTLRRFQASMQVEFAPGQRARLRLRPTAGQLALGLGVRVPAEAEPGSILRLDLVRRAEKRERLLGGLAIEIRVKKGNGPQGTPAEGIGGALRG